MITLQNIGKKLKLWSDQLVALTIIVATIMVGIHFRGDIAVVDTLEYKSCMAVPTSKCLADLAIEALPSDHQFFPKTSLGQLAQSLAHVDNLEWVKQRTSFDAISSDLIKKLIVRRFEQIELEDAKTEIPPNFSPSAYYTGAHLRINDHFLYGGGRGDIVAAEKAEFIRRGPPLVTARMNTYIDVWSQSIERTDETKRGRYWLAYASQMMTLNIRSKARHGLSKALEYYPGIIGFYRLEQMVRFGEPDFAIKFAENEPDKNHRARYLAKVAKFLAIARYPARSQKVLKALRKLLPSIKANYKKMDVMLDIIFAQKSNDDIVSAKKLAENIYSLAREPAGLSSHGLLRAVEAYYLADESGRARKVLLSLIQSIPKDDKVVGFGFHFGPVRYDGALKWEVLVKSVRWLCKFGDKDAAIKLATEIGNQGYRTEAAENLYACLSERPNNEITPDLLAQRLNLKTPFAIHLRKATIEIVAGQKMKAVNTIRHLLTVNPPYNFVRKGHWGSYLLRLSVAIRNDDLSKSILKKILMAERKSNDRFELAKRLSLAAAIVQKRF